jgi:hypothetical protein
MARAMQGRTRNIDNRVMLHVVMLCYVMLCVMVAGLTRQRLVCVDVSCWHEEGVHAVVASLRDQLSHNHATVGCFSH